MRASTGLGKAPLHQSRLFAWGLAAILSLFAVYPALLNPIEEHAYDAAVAHVYRGVVFSEALADGWLYPRWVQSINAGLGGPLFSFYSPLAYYEMDLLHHLGVTLPATWRVSVALAFFVGMLGAFGLGLTLFQRADVALVSAVAFTYTHYLLQELFERGSPQGLAIALAPWALWALARLVQRPTPFAMLGASLGWAAVILMHNATALLLTPLVGLLLVYLAWRDGPRRVGWVALAWLIGWFLAAFYLLPSSTELAYVQISNFTKADYAQPALNPLRLSELLALPPPFDTGLDTNSFGQHVSWLSVLVIALGLGLAWRSARQRRTAEVIWFLGLTGLGIVILWMQTASATLVWQAIPALAVLQFRWRLLSLMGFITMLLLGYALLTCPVIVRRGLIVALPVLLIGLEIPTLYPALLHRYNAFPAAPTATEAQAYALHAGLPGLTTFNEFLPRWRTLGFTDEEAEAVTDSPIANLPAGARVTSAARRTGDWQLQIESGEAFRAQVRQLYFPGWAAYVDGKSVAVTPMPDTGYLLADVPSGSHTLRLRYEGTLTQHVANWLSGLAVVVLAALCLWMTFGAAPRVAESARDSGAAYPQPRWWLTAGLLAVVALKAIWIDPDTTLFRRTSTCEAVQGATTIAPVAFGDNIRLCAYALSRAAYAPGEWLDVTLYWQLRQPMSESLRTFVHFLGKRDDLENAPLGGGENKEVQAGLPLNWWEPGKLYADHYAFRIGDQAPPGDYQLEIGWWRPTDGQRLPPVLPQTEAPLAVSRYQSLLLLGLTIRK